MDRRHNFNATHLDSAHVPAEFKDVLTRLIIERTQTALDRLEDLETLAILID